MQTDKVAFLKQSLELSELASQQIITCCSAELTESDIEKEAQECWEHKIETEVKWEKMNLLDSQKQQLKELLKRHKAAFAQSELDLGYFTKYEFHLETSGHPPRCRPYRVPHSLLPKMKARLEQLERCGLIRPSSSQYCSPALLVPKKDGDVRLVIDYSKLNLITKHDAFPLPIIQDVIDKLGGSQFFTSIDLQSAFHQLGLTSQSEQLTAFVTPFGVHQWTRVPMGIQQGPGWFQNALSSTLYDIESADCYIDDIVAYTKTWEGHLATLDKLLTRLEAVNLKAKLGKCIFAAAELPFLGQIISSQGSRPDPQKLSIVTDWKVPANVSQLRKFIGFCSYYRRYLSDFSKHAKVLYHSSRVSGSNRGIMSYSH